MYPDIPAALAIALILGGLWVVKTSADVFIDGAVAVARIIRLPPFVVGMVIVGFGTSAPELCVSVLSGIGGKPDLSLGNAYGSCICNIALILGVSALVSPLAVSRKTRMFSVPALLAITLLSWFLAVWGDGFSRADAFISLGVFAVGLPLYCFLHRTPQTSSADSGDALPRAGRPLLAASLKLLAGLAFLVGASHLLVWGAVDVARSLGVSELLIGLTILAVGTSLPELASSIVASRRREHDIVLGNIIGSNFFNTLAVVGIAGAITPFSEFSPFISVREMPVLLALTVSIAVIPAVSGGRVGRVWGAIWVAAYAAYIATMAYQELPA